MLRAPTAPQGGATPQPLPARPRKARAVAARALHVFKGLPALVLAGAAFLGLGLALDAGYHLIHGITPHSHAGAFDVAMVIHLIVVAGMALCMAGVVSAGVRSARSARKLRRQDR